MACRGLQERGARVGRQQTLGLLNGSQERLARLRRRTLPRALEAGDRCRVLQLLLGLLMTERVSWAGSSGPLWVSCCCCYSACRTAQACSVVPTLCYAGGSRGAKRRCWQSRGHPWWPWGGPLSCWRSPLLAVAGQRPLAADHQAGPSAARRVRCPCPAQPPPVRALFPGSPGAGLPPPRVSVFTLDPPGARGQTAGHRGRAPSP